MKFVDEYRNAEIANRYVEAIAHITTRPWTIMEICGGQTHSIVKYGIDKLLPQSITLIHGPGCPVCVTPVDLIDKAIALASRSEIIFCSFGDMLRVPGSKSQDLLSVKAMGGKVRIVYSPLAEPLEEREGILYAELDFNAIADMAHWHDATGHYSRPDLLSLLVNNEKYRVTRSFGSKSNNQLPLTDIDGKQDGLARLSADIKQLKIDLARLNSEFSEKIELSTQSVF
ncbi:MAG: hypothetical protein QNJ41_28540 [Xenococcaceae cyanobacterium MO_188.B32]|nr:hypothetical protein [Xenococcaceae cyanobacterium MO_188.B32]